MSKSILTTFLKEISGDVRSLVVHKVAAYLSVEIFGLLAFYHLTKNSMMEIIKKPSPIWVTIIAALVVLPAYIRLKQQINSFEDKGIKLKKHFGILWDDKLNAHCPACRNLLANYAYYKTYSGEALPGFMCINCNNTVVRISDEQQIFMSLEDAKKKLTK